MHQPAAPASDPSPRADARPGRTKGVRGVLALGLEVLRRVVEHNVPGEAARLSYYFFLAVFPLLIFLVGVLGLTVQGNAELEAALHHYLRAVAPPAALGLLQNTLREITESSSGGVLSFGLLLSVWAASSGMVAVIEALNIAYEVSEVRRWWKRRIVAIVLTIGYTVFISLALLLLLYGSHAARWLDERFVLGPQFMGTWAVTEWLLVLAFVLLAFNLLYYYAPNVKHRRWRWLMPGTVVAVVLWLLASFGFQLYLGLADRFSAAYGSLGAVIALLLWFYLSGMALLIGGEVNSELEHSAGEVEEAHDP